jgi:hypothetical protein
MANLYTTPWNFTTADQAVTKAATAITRNGLRSATVAALAHGFVKNQAISLQGFTPSAWNGGYRIEEIVDANNFLIRIEDWRSALANGGAGNALTAAYYGNVIWIQQALWDGATTGTLLITDVTGDIVWNPGSPSFSGTLTYMKAEPVNGLVINTLTAGTLQISIH